MKSEEISLNSEFFFYTAIILGYIFCCTIYLLVYIFFAKPRKMSVRDVGRHETHIRIETDLQ